MYYPLPLTTTLPCHGSWLSTTRICRKALVKQSGRIRCLLPHRHQSPTLTPLVWLHVWLRTVYGVLQCIGTSRKLTSVLVHTHFILRSLAPFAGDHHTNFSAGCSFSSWLWLGDLYYCTAVPDGVRGQAPIVPAFLQIVLHLSCIAREKRGRSNTEVFFFLYTSICIVLYCTCKMHVRNRKSERGKQQNWVSDPAGFLTTARHFVPALCNQSNLYIFWLPARSSIPIRTDLSRTCLLFPFDALLFIRTFLRSLASCLPPYMEFVVVLLFTRSFLRAEQSVELRVILSFSAFCALPRILFISVCCFRFGLLPFFFFLSSR